MTDPTPLDEVWEKYELVHDALDRACEGSSDKAVHDALDALQAARLVVEAAAKAEAVEPLLHTLDQARTAWIDVIGYLPAIEGNVQGLRATAERERAWGEEVMMETRRALSTGKESE